MERAKGDSVDRKRVFYGELLGWCAQNNRKSGLAYYAYKDAYGIFPAGVVMKGVMALEPSAATTEYMNGRAVARKEGGEQA